MYILFSLRLYSHHATHQIYQSLVTNIIESVMHSKNVPVSHLWKAEFCESYTSCKMVSRISTGVNKTDHALDLD